MVSRSVNRAHDKLPLARIHVSFDVHDIAELEIISPRQVDSDDAGVALALESFELIFVNDKFGIEVEERIRIGGQTREKLILIDVDSREPYCVGDSLYARDLRDPVLVGQGKRKDERHSVACNQSIRRRRVNASVPCRHHGAQESKRHHSDAHTENCQQATQFVAQRVAKKKPYQLQDALLRRARLYPKYAPTAPFPPHADRESP